MNRIKYYTLLLLLALISLEISAAGNPNSTPQPRKKIGLVLSGGGAKGMAHIGAMQVIKDLGIPIDIVVGTSMGSIIGGMYSIGYTPEKMDSIVRKQDWSFLLSDRVMRSEQNVTERKNQEKYIISVPFSKAAKAEILGGLIKGQNLDNLFSELTIGYHDSIDFNTLPIPFACVSEDIVTGKEINFHNGVLSTAMRASMAIPGVFTPVRHQGMVLVDGGVVNNYPVNVAKAMGADYIIGIDVQSELRPEEELESAGSILGQLVDLMGQEKYEENLKQTDAHIKVDVRGYSAASFTPQAIDSLIFRGKNAALKAREDLLKVKKAVGLDSLYMPEGVQPYQYHAERKVHVKKVIFNGLNEKDKRWLLKRCELKEESDISIEQIEKATAVLASNLGYLGAQYKLHKVEEDTYDLEYTIRKKYENKINLGIRFDTKETASILVNANSYFHRGLPSRLSFTGRLGKRYTAGLEYSLELAPLQQLNFSYVFKYYDVDFDQNGHLNHNSTFRYHKGEISFANAWTRNLRFKFGTRYELYNYNNTLYEKNAHRFDVSNEHFFNYFAIIDYETFDKGYFPSRGVGADLSYTLYTDNFARFKGSLPFSAIKGRCEFVVPFSNRFSVIPSIYGRFLIGKNIPYAKMNMMGGDIPARILTQQLPFYGTDNVEITKKSLLIGCLKFRQRMGTIHYLTLTGNYALTSNNIENIFKEKTYLGGGIGYGMDSGFGPLEVLINYMNHSNSVSFYVNLGYKF